MSTAIPEKKWSNPFREGTFMYDIFGKVLRENRDIIILVSDHRGRRGTGKTVSSLSLASNLDQTEEGLTWSKCTLAPEELRNAYTEQPQRSALVLDEAEAGVSNREAMTVTNRALREIMSMGRVEQKYVVANVPIKGFVDKDILKMTSVWISMTQKGRGLVHNLKWDPYSERLYPTKKQWLTFEDIDTGTQLREVYNKLTQEKKKRLAGKQSTGFVPKEEHESELSKARKEARREVRDDIVDGIYNHPEIDASQSDIGDAVGVSQKTVSNIVNRAESD